MNKYINRILFLSFIGLCYMGCESPVQQINRCGAAEHFAEQIENSPDFLNKFNRIEREIQEYYNTVPKGASGLRGGRLIIPVVVHILHKGEAVGTGTNLSNARIESQITALNRDYRRMNADISDVPSDFSSLTADPRIEFQLARRSPDCEDTNGITRQRAGRTSYTATQAKSTTTDGVNPWDTDKYLNIWVVDSLLSSSGSVILGSSSFPADPDNQQGFVSGAIYFGQIGAVPPRFNLGRTGVHELGHYFNLFHIGGRNAPTDSNCTDSDDVDDTPNQLTQYENLPTPPSHPERTCSSNDMFMNYMDYVDDTTMVMFSQGQVDRMIASLYTTQRSLIGSDGLYPPPEGSSGSSADLFIQDTPEDVANEPNNESDIFYISEDIWVRQSRGATNQEHQTPTYSAGVNRYVYVRVRNNGCSPSTTSNVKLYWAKASSGLSWPTPWNGSTLSGVTMGGEIGTQPSGVIQGGGFTVLEYEWSGLPNPSDYSSFGADSVHFCLLARIESGITTTETANLWNNVKNNNNIAWKNISIMSTGPSGGREASILVGNYEKDREYDMSLIFQDANETELSAFDYGDVIVELSPKLMEKWVEGGAEGSGITRINETQIQISRSGARLDGMLMNPMELYVCKVICREGKPKIGPNVYFMDLIQVENGANNDKIGGQRFMLKVWNQ